MGAQYSHEPTLDIQLVACLHFEGKTEEYKSAN